MHAPNFGEECIPEADPKIDYCNVASNTENSFLLVSRGDCEFVTKTLNAQKLGAQMAIIMDDKKHEGSIVMADNGYGTTYLTQVTKSTSHPSSSTTRVEISSKNY